MKPRKQIEIPYDFIISKGFEYIGKTYDQIGIYCDRCGQLHNNVFIIRLEKKTIVRIGNDCYENLMKRQNELIGKKALEQKKNPKEVDLKYNINYIEYKTLEYDMKNNNLPDFKKERYFELKKVFEEIKA